MEASLDVYNATPSELKSYLEERLKRAFECQESGRLLFGGQEVQALWESAAQAFVSRNWIGVVLAAQALCERGIAAKYALQDLPGAVDYGRKDVRRKALGALIRWAREDGLVDPGTLDRVQVLCDRRRTLTHLIDPMDPNSMASRVFELIRIHPERYEDAQGRLMAEDAVAALDAVFELCFGDFGSVATEASGSDSSFCATS